MNTRPQRIFPCSLAILLAEGSFTGCERRGDPIAAAGQADRRVGVTAPGIGEAKAIAEEGFIYGLPIVNCGYIGSRATGTEPGDYLVAGPGWTSS